MLVVVKTPRSVEVSWSQIVSELEFADQDHLVFKDFVDFAVFNYVMQTELVNFLQRKLLYTDEVAAFTEAKSELLFIRPRLRDEVDVLIEAFSELILNFTLVLIGD